SLFREKRRIHRPVVLVRQARQVTQSARSRNDRLADAPLFLRAAYLASDDDAFWKDCTGLLLLRTSYGDAVLVSRHFHPLVRVVHDPGRRLFDVEADVMNYGGFARQHLDSRNPGVLLERATDGQGLPIENPVSGYWIRRKFNGHIRLDRPASGGPLNGR